MRSEADRDFIRDRVLQDVKEQPSIRPYLGEPAPRARRAFCGRGHAQTGSGRCRECERVRKRRRRAEGVTW